jgi:hypothetical protein
MRQLAKGHGCPARRRAEPSVSIHLGDGHLIDVPDRQLRPVRSGSVLGRGEDACVRGGRPEVGRASPDWSSPSGSARCRSPRRTENDRVLAESVSHLTVGHPPTVEEGVQTDRGLLRPSPAARVVRQPREREDSMVPRRHDVGAETRARELNERGILPDGRVGTFDTRVNRKERSAGHAVLQARPCRAPERTGAAREPLVERTDVPPKREDLRPC